MKVSLRRTVQPRLASWLCAASLALALALSIAAPADAGEVYGQVNLNGNPVRMEIVLTLIGGGTSVRVRTNSRGEYSIVLAPGVYTVTAEVSGDTKATAIQSYLVRARQDVHFHDN